MRGRLLAIGGSDSGGGAGIQADIKTALALGAYAGSAITAVTVQDTRAVYVVHRIAPKLVADQITRFLDDTGADAVKCGMLVDGVMIEAVSSALAGSQVPLVLDPVIIASSGRALLKAGAISALLEHLLPRATLVTPNLPEASQLTGISEHSPAFRERAAERLLRGGASAVLIKGGHGSDAVLHDRLFTQAGDVSFSHARIDTRHTHGTGCTLAAAIAVGLAQGLALSKAAERGIAYVQAALATAPGLGGGAGPLNHAAWMGEGSQQPP
ncbi:MAG: bifunctional hydroxymethylpyrimidine kinase/phosphomethylpyrimidine kinase [Acidocella sp.]|nr:bifunctional hydroxymethylpyrimidine kinase/phosphomethylpyrimidine kinase [Acidocella sp.]